MPSRARKSQPSSMPSGIITESFDTAIPESGGVIHGDIDITEPGATPDESGVIITDTDDGGAVVDFAPESAAILSTGAHDENLAELMAEETLDAIGTELIEAVTEDIESRHEWEQSYLRGIKLLGLKIEDRTTPFKGACGVFDPLLAEAVLRAQATLRGELLPAAGPVKTSIVGSESDEVMQQSDRVKTWMNYYLTRVDKGYYEDFDQGLMWNILAGSVFRKVYQDTYLNWPRSRFITPDQFVVSYTTTDLQSCPRATHIIKPSPREFRGAQLHGIYRDIELGVPDEKTDISPTTETVDKEVGISSSNTHRGDDRHTLYECYVDWDMKGFEHRDVDPTTGIEGEPTGWPLPYIVTVDKDSRKVLRVERNWKQGDPLYQKRERFAHYKFFPGLGFYGFGLTHFLGGHAKAATSILRQLVDSGTLNNFPGGVRVKGMRIEDNNLGIGPCEFKEIETGGQPIQNAIMPMPYKEPSVVLMQLRTEISESARRLGATTDIAVGEGRQDAPVGTTLALLEAATKVESGVVKRMYVAQAEEFGMLADLFGEILPAEPYPYRVSGGDKVVMRADFDGRIDVIPVGDPNIPSSSQRMIRAEGRLRMAQSAPQIHDIREAFVHMYRAMGAQDGEIERIMPPPQQAVPMDPVSENQMSMLGKPLAVGLWQDDDDHIAVHMAMAEVPGMSDHMATHLGNKFRKAIEQALGIQLPPLGQKMPPEIENEIAHLVAQVSDQVKGEMAGQEGELNPLAVAMEEIKVKAAAIQAKLQEAKIKDASFRWGKMLEYTADTADRQADMKIDREKIDSAEKIARMRPAPKAGGK